MPTNEKDLFCPQTGGISFGPPIVLEIKGVVVPFKKDNQEHTLKGIPTFKNSKRVLVWIDKARRKETFSGGYWWIRRDTVKIQSSLITLPQHQKWMELAIQSLQSQLLSALAITAEKIRTVACPRSWIASRVPLDDAWTWCPEITIKSEKCEPGQEGATIVIQRIK